MKRTFHLLIPTIIALFASVNPGFAEQHPSPFGVNAELVEHEGTKYVRFNFTMPPEHVLYAARLKFETTDGQPIVPATISAPATHVDEKTGEEKQVYEHNFSADLKFDPAAPVSVVVKFQGCSNAACYFPERHEFNVSTSGVLAVNAAEESNSVSDASTPSTPVATGGLEGFIIAGRETGFVSKSDLIAFLDAAKNGASTATGVFARLGEFGLTTTLILIVLGGLGLNLTPCVLPMIPINLAIIGAGARASSRKRGFALGTVYGSGMALAYGVLGLFVVFTGSKFGTLNSSPWFNFAIAAIFIVMALGMFDVVNIDLSRFQSGSGSQKRGQKSQFIVAFTIGIVAALLAGACVAPVVISVLLLATQLYGKGIVPGLALPFLLGIGMALPWPFAGAGLSFLPKPGKWMKYVKYSFGTFIILFALYYGYLGGGLFLSQHSLRVEARSRPDSATPAISRNDEFYQALARARAEGRPVFIDFAASWCKNCEAMDAAVFPAAEVKEKLKNFAVVKYDAEKPNESPAREILDRFGVMGLPTYVVLVPKK